MTFPFRLFKVDLLADYKSLDIEASSEQKWHLGALLNFGALNFSTGLDAYGISSGVYYALDSITAGILYSTTRLPWRPNDYYSQTVYVQLGWQIN